MKAAHLFLNKSLAEPEPHLLPAGEVVVYTAHSPDKDGANEDCAGCFLIADDSVVLSVADGAGGMAAGAKASATAIRKLHTALKTAASEPGRLRGAILNGIEQANSEIVSSAEGAATTVAVAEICAGIIRPYHVGDSMVLVVGQRGKIKLETVSHSPVGYAVESGLLGAEEAMHHDERHIVSNLVGSADMHIAVGPPTRLAAKDTVLLASDGLSDNLHIGEIAELIRKGPMRQAARGLARRCQERMRGAVESKPSKPDDLTFILYRQRIGGRSRTRQTQAP